MRWYDHSCLIYRPIKRSAYLSPIPVEHSYSFLFSRVCNANADPRKKVTINVLFVPATLISVYLQLPPLLLCDARIHTTEQVARLAVAFGMVVTLAKDTRPPSPGKEDESDAATTSKRAQVAGGIGVAWPPVHLDELLVKSDYVSLHVPLTAGTKGLIADRELALMKESAVIVNTARGGLVDERGAWV